MGERKSFKLLLVGDSGVGKSSMLLRFTDDHFDEEIGCTIGVDFKVKTMEVNGSRVNLTIWDTAGQEKFRSLTSSYYRGTQGIILVYDVSRRDTFDHLNMWLKEISMYCLATSVVKLLVGNKIDQDERQVPREEGEKFARSNGMVFLECSAKTNKGIQQTFEEMVLKILDNQSLEIPASQESVKLSTSARAEEQDSCYC
mmetsp:Transcript_33958/g.85215  ORF Transcript_33958/g.85215 Transcript_33958/m.85215 type:complete len:199 (-) Transcript_33958:405-1001(-)|eukprot:CAMPEP_0177648434 /NCGR_PEP_ID=MMETSP0447-20121125/10824_1 /TAXON_ID=0 /ORGANISM="Stygamoeba regulata, Strain BSH-02190019" /LENGTH=198 /DNA_ID=CAMNT_0019151071 /DNA_START=208 /DNA_END=804 /DNA_ORIENTATION=+